VRPSRRVRRRPSRLPLLATGLAGLWLAVLSRGFWWPTPPPAQMILVLGGDAERERVAAHLARADGLPVVVSGGTNPEYATWLFREREGLPANQVRLDYRASDTLTNFTSLVDDLRQARVRHALLVTSTDHMTRALLVGRIVAGSRGIHLTPVAVPCGKACVTESWKKIAGDGLRASVWVLSGRDLKRWGGAELAGWLRRTGVF
jgi:uncharacterized SAM-binding protein YcdF (DUF218 family)